MLWIFLIKEIRWIKTIFIYLNYDTFSWKLLINSHKLVINFYTGLSWLYNITRFLIMKQKSVSFEKLNKDPSNEKICDSFFSKKVCFRFLCLFDVITYCVCSPFIFVHFWYSIFGIGHSWRSVTGIKSFYSAFTWCSAWNVRC